MSSLNKVRLTDGTEVSMAEWYHQPRYSTFEFAAADAINGRLFNYTPGQPVSHTASIAARSATDIDTNMVKRKAMNQDEALVVMAITYECFALSAEADNSGDVIAPVPLLSGTDLRRLQVSCMFDLMVGAGQKKPQYSVPFGWLCQSMGVRAYAGDSGATSTHLDYGTGGVLAGHNQELLKLPIYIGGFGQHAKPGNAMHFQAKFYNPAGGAISGLRQNVKLRIHLDGLSKRPA